MSALAHRGRSDDCKVIETFSDAEMETVVESLEPSYRGFAGPSLLVFAVSEFAPK